MRTHLDAHEPAFRELTNDERVMLDTWLTQIVGPDVLVRGLELTGEGSIRVEMYVDAAGKPAVTAKGIYIDRLTNVVATAWFDYPAAMFPPVWPD